jgi:hypothetical protein
VAVDTAVMMTVADMAAADVEVSPREG